MNVYFNDSQSILVVNPKGKMRKLYVPFRVLDTTNGSWVYVSEVGIATNGVLVYLINGHAYPHSQFQIRIQF